MQLNGFADDTYKYRRPTTIILITFRCTSHAIALTNRPLEYDEPFTLEITRINPD